MFTILSWFGLDQKQILIVINLSYTIQLNIDADPWWTVGLAMIGKFQIACSFAVIYVYAGELMPTVVRSQVAATLSHI